MSRIRNLLFIFTAVFVAINSFAIDGNSEVLSKEYLVNNKWGPNIGDLGLYFTFTMDNTFTTEANFEGGAYYSGTYKINDKRLIVKIIKAGEGRELIGKELIYKLARDNNTIYFTKYLELENSAQYKAIDIKELWNQSSIVKNGEKRIYRNRKVETINNLAIVRETTNYYQFPSAASKRFMFSIHDGKNDTHTPFSYVVPPQADWWFENKQVRLILRTTELDSNKQRWYYIVLPVGNGGYNDVKIEGSSYDGNGSNLGWIKGTDIKRIIKK